MTVRYYAWQPKVHCPTNCLWSLFSYFATDEGFPACVIVLSCSSSSCASVQREYGVHPGCDCCVYIWIEMWFDV